jgi:hypothetical protein
MTAPTPGPYLDWFVQHIPHRVRSAFAGTEMLVLKLSDCCFGKENVRTAGFDARITSQADSVALHCLDNAVWEGRLTAMRWLIDFVGVRCDKNGKPSRPAQKPHDCRIDKMAASLFPLFKTLTLPPPSARIIQAFFERKLPRCMERFGIVRNRH